jgi:hypothetical protein
MAQKVPFSYRACPACKNTPLVLQFSLCFVPSLSWQNDRFLEKNRQKSTVFLPAMGMSPTSSFQGHLLRST